MIFPPKTEPTSSTQSKKRSDIVFSKRNKRMLGVILRGLCVLALLIIFYQHRGRYIDSSHHIRKSFYRDIVLVTGLSIVTVFLPLIRDRIPYHLNDLWRRWMFIFLTLVSPLGIFQLIEFLHTKKLFYRYSPEIILYNYILILSIGLIFYALTNRIKLSILITYILLLGFSILNYYVYTFRGEPILAADIYDLETAANVADAYEFTITKYVYASLFTVPFGEMFLEMLPSETRRPRRIRRLFSLTICSLIFCSCFYLIAFTNYMHDRGYKLRMFESYRSYKSYGQTLSFTWSFHYILVEKPEGYSVKELKNTVVKKYKSDPVQTATKATEETPNLFFIMNESFADLELLGDLGATEDPMPYIHSLEGQDNVIVGNLYTEGFGGKTANTEYEVLTGSNMTFLPNSCVAYTVFVRDTQPSFNWNLYDMGYSGLYGFHPYNASGYRRNVVYPMLGFQNTLFLEDIESELTEDDYLRTYVTDEADYRWLIKAYEETRAETEAPFYMYNVTMQNHGSYTMTDSKMDMSIDIDPDLKEADSRAYLYTNLLKYTDDAFKQLTEYFSNVDEPTVIVFFGDHEPGLNSEFLTELTGVEKFNKKKVFKKYHVPLIIWANYDINPDGAHNRMFRKIGSNYLGAKVAKLLDFPLTGFQKYLLKLSRELPVISLHGSWASDGQYVKYSNKNSGYYERIREYNAIVYNYQIDTKNRIDKFFKLKEAKE